MEPYIVIPEPLMHDTGHDMLPRVLLHLLKSLLKADAPVNPLPLFKRSVRIVVHDAFFFMDVKHLYAAKLPAVRILASALRKKGSPVQNHLVLIPVRQAGADCRVKFLHVAVFIK